MDNYETTLTHSARQIIGALELGIKVYLKGVIGSNLAPQHKEQLDKKPNFYQQIELLKIYAEPTISEEMISAFFDYRSIRNPAEHDAAVPPVIPLHDAVNTIRKFFVTYLPVEEDKLNQVELKVAPNGSLEKTFSNNENTLAALTHLDIDEIPKPKKIELVYELDPNDTGRGPMLWVSFSPDGRTLASSGSIQSVQFWDVNTGIEVKRLKNFLGVNSLAFSPNGLTIATGVPHKVFLWHFPTLKKTIEIHLPDIREVWCLGFSPGGDILITGGIGGRTSMWDAKDTKNTKKLLDFPATFSDIRRHSFSPNGKLLALAGGDACIWDIETNKEYRYFSLDGVRFTTVSFSPSGEYLILGSNDGVIRLWSVTADKEVRQFVGHSEYVTCLAFHPDGNLIASGSTDNTLRLWDVKTGIELQQIGEHKFSVETVAFNSDGKHLAFANSTHTIQIWKIENTT